MATIQQTVERIINAATWDQRIAQIRLVEQNHGTAEHGKIFAEVAREAYVPHLAPDFAYIHDSRFYDRPYFTEVYQSAYESTEGFSLTSELELTRVLIAEPRTMLVFRTMTGLTQQEFSHSTRLVSEPLGKSPVSAGKLKAMEQIGSLADSTQAKTIASTLVQIMDGSLFGHPENGLRVKQQKIDTQNGWHSIRDVSDNGVKYSDFLHQRHYGGAFRQVLDATSTKRGDLLEDAVEQLFQAQGVPYIRTGAHEQSEIERRFEIRVTPAPDFVVFDDSGTLRAMLECKLVNDGGTARDKALRFERLRSESKRLGGVPLLAVLAGMGWSRVNDTLGPVVRDTEGRVFTLATLTEMLDVAPFPMLKNLV